VISSIKAQPQTSESASKQAKHVNGK